MFAKGMFKEALINITASFDSLSKQSEVKPLALKINEY
jgi:hypothetical protein